MRKKKLQYLRHLVGVRCCDIFLPGNNVRPESKGNNNNNNRQHALVNEIWDEGQLGAVEGVLGTVDQLIIDRCIMEDVKQHHRNLAVAFYDYKKAYDKVHHDWMIRVYEWIGIPRM